jgi:hypothetical protein
MMWDTIYDTSQRILMNEVWKKIVQNRKCCKLQIFEAGNPRWLGIFADEWL